MTDRATKLMFRLLSPLGGPFIFLFFFATVHFSSICLSSPFLGGRCLLLFPKRDSHSIFSPSPFLPGGISGHRRMGSKFYPLPLYLDLAWLHCMPYPPPSSSSISPFMVRPLPLRRPRRLSSLEPFRKSSCEMHVISLLVVGTWA